MEEKEDVMEGRLGVCLCVWGGGEPAVELLHTRLLYPINSLHDASLSLCKP